MNKNELNIWDDTLPPASQGRGLYVAISGNTAAGKSSLIAALEGRALERGVPALGVSERLFHHPYLRLMFSQPQQFAFPIQLAFMLQRHLVLLRNLALGRMVIIERSHLDDELFVREHASQGCISQGELDAYFHLARELHAKIPAPDVLVLMNPRPELSLARLAQAETRGERPHEFPSEEAKAQWVERWYALYVKLHQDYKWKVANAPEFSATTLVEQDPQVRTEAIAAQVWEVIARKLGPMPRDA